MSGTLNSKNAMTTPTPSSANSPEPPARPAMPSQKAPKPTQIAQNRRWQQHCETSAQTHRSACVQRPRSKAVQQRVARDREQQQQHHQLGVEDRQIGERGKERPQVHGAISKIGKQAVENRSNMATDLMHESRMVR